MTPEQIDRVFGRGRLKMVTGEHVEVYREAVAPGERRRYTKRFLATREGDFGQWTEREWRILARLIGHGITCVPEVVQFDRGRVGGMRIVQTYDAGVTVDQWATLLPMIREDRIYRHVFEDCGHWWALAHHCLLALQEIHRLELVHLDIKGDNVCIPYAPASFDPDSPDPSLKPVFAQFALIDFAFALVSKESLTTPLPLGWQREYDYQSPRLLAALEKGREGDLQATRELDWRCDMYSLAAMLKRYLPDGALDARGARSGWTPPRYDSAKALILRIREAHDTESPARRPHPELIETTAAALNEADLARSLERGWSLARELTVSATSPSPLTPVTRVAPVTRIATPIHVLRSGRTAVTVVPPVSGTPEAQLATTAAANPPMSNVRPRRERFPVALLSVAALAVVGGALWAERTGTPPSLDGIAAPLRAAFERASDSTGGWLRRDEVPRVAATETATSAAKAAPAPATAGRDAPELPAAPARREAPKENIVASAPALAVPASIGHPASASAAPRPAPLAEPRSSSSDVHAQPRAVEPYRTPLARALAPSPSRANPRTASSSAPAAGTSATPRSHAPWASLQPPAWITSRNRSPGNPPGYKEPETPIAAATESPAQPASVESAPAEQEKPGAAPAAALAADSPRSASAVAAPLPGRPAKDAKAGAPRATPQGWFAARSAAPVEDRSVNLAQASTPVPEVRNAPVAEGPRPDDPRAQAQRLVADTVPGIARQGELEISRVLVIAASAYKPAQDRTLADAARMARIRDDALLQPLKATAPDEARRLHDRARSLQGRGRIPEALDLELRAFNANPRDPEITGQLAVLYLKATPSRPDTARELALMALTARSSQYGTTRLEDWQTFAAASALAGRETDARNALFVTLALSSNVERTCVAVWNAVGSYGPRLHSSVDALLYRVHMRGHSVDSPWCAYPPDWTSPPRLAGELALGH